MKSHPDVVSTGIAAKICQVSQQTIIRCFDAGIKLAPGEKRAGALRGGFRVPGSSFRRIPLEALYKFMKEHGLPTDELRRYMIENGLPTDLLDNGAAK